MGISKSKQKSSSSNQAFPFLRDTLGGTVGAANTGAQGIAALGAAFGVALEGTF